MKKFLGIAIYCAALCVTVQSMIYGQITVQRQDVESILKPNASVLLYSDTSIIVNVGSTGGPNIYDFSSLTFSDSVLNTVFTSSNIPSLALRFDPNSLVWGQSTQSIGGSPVFVLSDSSLTTVANVTVNSELQSYDYNIPGEMTLRFPTTYAKQWSTQGAGMGSETTYVNNSPPSIRTGLNSAEDYIVDGYGTLIVKGKAHQCLRIKSTEVNGYTAKTFFYVTKDNIWLFINSRKSQNDTGLVAADTAGIHILSGLTVTSVSAPAAPPTDFSLGQNYPNPFNPSTTISYQVAEKSTVRITVYTILGSEIATLVDEQKPAGRYEVQWDAREFPSGMYFYRLEAGPHTLIKKMILLK